MNWKTTWLLLALALALFAFIDLVERHTSPTSAAAAPPARLLSLSAGTVTNISLRRTNQLILRAERAGASWNLTAPLFYPAQTFAIENLLQTLPARHHPALFEELGLLDREIERHFTYPEDRMLAHVADTQGLGGHRGTIKH